MADESRQEKSDDPGGLNSGGRVCYISVGRDIQEANSHETTPTAPSWVIPGVSRYQL